LRKKLSRALGIIIKNFLIRTYMCGAGKRGSNQASGGIKTE
jgi:hypothetical protein